MTTNTPAVRYQRCDTYVQPQTLHQQAVNSLLEVALATPEFCAAFPDVEFSVPREKVPGLFRAAIKEQKSRRLNPHREETAILETALALLEHAKDDQRTPEQDEFYSNLAFKWDEREQRIGIAYDPEHVSIN